MWRYSRQQNFTGGENRQLTPEFVADNQVIVAGNCIITEEGLLQTRLGKTAGPDALGTGAVISVHRYVKEDGNGYLLAQFGSSLYHKAYQPGGAWSGAWTLTKEVVGAQKLRSVTWRNKLILTNGAYNPFTFDGTTCTDLGGSPPKSKYIAVYAGRLWFVDSSYPNLVRFSDLEDYNVWDALNVINVRDGDGDTISGLAPLDGGLVITKYNSVWALYGTNISNMRLTTSPISEHAGCYAPDTLLTSARIFMGKDGLYTFDLASVRRLPPTHDVIINSIQWPQRQGAFAAYQSLYNRVIVSFPDTARTTLCVDLKFGCITSWSGLNVKSYVVPDAAGDSQELIIGDATNGKLYLLNNHDNDDGTAIETLIWTAYRDMGGVRDKVFRMFQPEVEAINAMQSSINYYYDVDYNAVSGVNPFSASVNSVLYWNSGKWNETAWGPVPRINDALWMHSARGKRVSYGIKSIDRIKLIGYTTKFREVGII